MDAKTHDMTPAQRVTAGLCPETGHALDGRNIEAHIRDLWPNFDDRNPAHAEAAKRIKMLRAYASQRKDE